MTRLLLLIAFMGSTGFTPILADVIYVSGDVSGIWSADTVMVMGEVRVPPGETLVIEPGVEVLFQVYCKLIVDNGATLSAVGTAADYILFDEFISGTRWHGLRFIGASSASRLEHCHLRRGLASGSWEDSNGGAVFCSNSSPTIRRCVIENCEADWCGGAISCSGSSPVISGNILHTNLADYGGAIYCSYSSHPTITGNLIIGNWVDNSYGFGGAISIGMDCNPAISDNIISANSASRGGAIFSGFFCRDSEPGNIPGALGGNPTNSAPDPISGEPYRSPEISGNVINNNWADLGGGIYLVNSDASILGNVISWNVESNYGGGIYCGENSNPSLLNSTISGNWTLSGGGVYCSYADPSLINCILWENDTQQIALGSSSNPSVSYSDVQGGWPGLGNIDDDPLFVDAELNDLRLQWGSPCIDAGDPDPQHNDPDGTRSDMGAFYYDQSMPVRILLTPHETPCTIPGTGGTMDFTIHATNINTFAHEVTVWCDVTLPDSTVVGPVLGPVTVTLGTGQTIARRRTQIVPAAAPMGVYRYNAYAVVDADTSRDSFMFGKLWPPGSGGIIGWATFGESLEDGKDSQIAPTRPMIYNLGYNYPNPFNPTTNIRFELPAASFVKLTVYDISGRIVGAQHAAPLLDGWLEAGYHEATFNGSGLTSGVYIYRLSTGEFTDSRKMVLIK